MQKVIDKFSNPKKAANDNELDEYQAWVKRRLATEPPGGTSEHKIWNDEGIEDLKKWAKSHSDALYDAAVSRQGIDFKEFSQKIIGDVGTLNQNTRGRITIADGRKIIDLFQWELYL